MRAVAGAYANTDSPMRLVHHGDAQGKVLEREIRDAGWTGKITHALAAQPGQWLGDRLLHYPAPMSSKMAWQRARHAGHALAFSGVTHTLSSHGVLTQIADYVDGAFHAWDALICTSRSAQKIVHQIFEEKCAQLAVRLRVPQVRPELPMTPVIPLGVHAQDFIPSQQKRIEARRTLGLDDEEVAVLFVGRLSFHAKANPWPMYKAVAEAARLSGKKVRLIECGRFANDAIRESFDAAAALAGAPMLRVDGHIPNINATVFAASDIFVSLSDNIQETFGLTPLEAMAAGLPVVVSDWDGYRETVRDGVDGFLIPTAQPGYLDCLNLVSQAYEDGSLNYDLYIAHAHAVVSVELTACVRALQTLIEDPSLRRKMGEAGRARVLQSYDWSVVIRSYQTLWTEQETMRAHAQQNHPVPSLRAPGFMNPLNLFDHYPTHLLQPGTTVRISPKATQEELLAVRRLKMWGFAPKWLASESELTKAWRVLSDAGDLGMSVERWAAALEWSISRTLIQAAWMMKVGVLAQCPGDQA